MNKSCACVSFDAKECFEMRHHLDSEDNDEACCCGCHDPDDDDDYDKADFEAMYGPVRRPRRRR